MGRLTGRTAASGWPAPSTHRVSILDSCASRTPARARVAQSQQASGRSPHPAYRWLMTGWRSQLERRGRIAVITWLHAWSTRLYGPNRRVSPLSWLGDERLAIGCVPTAATLPVLRAHGVTHIVNCRSRVQTRLSQDLALERELFGVTNVAHAPMWDFGRPQPPALWAAGALFAADALSRNPSARVLVHCHQGRRRSAMVAYAVLRLRGHDPDRAATLITQHRVEAVLVAAYVDSVERWLASRNTDAAPH